MTGGSYTILVTDPREHTRDWVEHATELANLLQSEETPEEPPYDVEVNLGRIRGLPASRASWAVHARSPEGSLVATSSISKQWLDDDNPDVGSLQISVHPDHRRAGLATQLLAHHVAFARELGRGRFHFDTTDRQPAGEAFAEALGASVKQESHENDLDLTTVDRALLHDWTQQARHRSTDYELLAVDGPIPDDIVEAYVELLDVMNTAPRDEIDVNDERLTVAQLRDGEAYMAAEGTENWRLLVRHTPTQRLVGLHDVAWGADAPKTAYVGNTGVLPAHRGHALGKWMKAAMTLRVLEDRAQATTIRTSNADSNDAMLAINTAMGYRPWRRTSTWEVARESVERWLTLRDTPLPEVSAQITKQRPST